MFDLMLGAAATGLGSLGDIWASIIHDFSNLDQPGALTALVQVLMIDLILAGDNAIVVGALAAGLPPEQRRRVILLGVLAALVLRILFALQNTPPPAAELPGLAIRGSVITKDRMFNDLLFILHEAGDRLRGEIIYNADRYEESTVAGIWEQFVAILRAVVLDSEQPLANLPGGPV